MYPIFASPNGGITHPLMSGKVGSNFFGTINFGVEIPTNKSKIKKLDEILESKQEEIMQV